MERDEDEEVEEEKSAKISTHTLTWSVTKCLTGTYSYEFISTHTLTWSVTIGKKVCWVCTKISTHTLTWSVTLQ